MQYSLKLYVLLIFLIPYTALSQNSKGNYDFSSIDKLIEQEINNRSFPSAALIIGDEKNIIYENYYGRLTYDESSRPATRNTIYDLASVTKVIATTSAIMKLYDEQKLDLDEPVYKYIPEFISNNKSDITIRNLLLHNSGLKAVIPFWQTMTTPEEVRNAIYNQVKEYPTGSKFVYSDLNAVLLGDIVEKITGMKLDKYCETNIFEPLGMNDTHFLIPMTEDYRIAPTENDTYWRHQLLVGYVHDETAAMLEGVARNAGLFSTAQDIYKFMKMMLNNGIYRDDRRSGPANILDTMFKPITVVQFTTKATDLGYLNSRALGWDTKPLPTSNRPACGDRFSANSFGHTGFTGTSVWADKDKKITVIFLTNRVYPSRDNNQMGRIRPLIHDEICKILDY